MEKYHVSVAAEAYAAASFARAGYEVSVQYGANQPGYDLVVVKASRILKVSVKGSQDGGWVLLGKHKKKDLSWKSAVQSWLSAQPAKVVMCFVQFCDIPFSELPRIYLVRAKEVAHHLLQGRGGHVSTCLLENYFYSKGVGKELTDKIPEFWLCTEKRIKTV